MDSLHLITLIKFSCVIVAEDSSVIGRPAEFALVDADGSPSFLEKALKFIEDHGKYFFSY